MSCFSTAGELPASLHEVRMPILSNKECEQMYYEAGYVENIRDVFVCAGLSSGGLDACEVSIYMQGSHLVLIFYIRFSLLYNFCAGLLHNRARK